MTNLEKVTTLEKVEQGSRAWFEMVGEVMSRVAEQAGLPADKSVSLVERYTDGTDFGDGLVQGFRFDIVGGQPSYRVGVGPSEKGDITVEVASRVAYELNQMPAAASAKARQNYMEAGDIRQEGDLSRLGAWFADAHKAILERTR